MESVCSLCNTPKELCRSHILPEFLYRPLYDEKHRFSILTAGVDNERYGQRGLTERLLCHACEQRLCQYEKYAAEVMSGRRNHRYQQHGGRITIKGIDYTRFKLFQISILWRASVSTLEFFKLVSLGQREELLRQMVLAGDPGNPEEFGCVVIFAHDRGHDISDTLFNPEPMRWGGRRMHKLFFAGAAWLYHCDQRPPAAHLQKFFLRPEGTLLGLFGDLGDPQRYGPSAKRLARRAGYA
jgi:hypothetical protein